MLQNSLNKVQYPQIVGFEAAGSGKSKEKYMNYATSSVQLYNIYPTEFPEIAQYSFCKKIFAY